MKCPSCGSEDAYIGFSDIDCPNEDCNHFNGNPIVTTPVAPAPNSGATKPGPLGPPGIAPVTTASRLSVTLIDKDVKRSSILITFKADGDPGYPDKIVEFYWWINGSNSKNVCTLSSKYRYHVAGVNADGLTTYKTHWRCTYDGIKPTDNWNIEARIS